MKKLTLTFLNETGKSVKLAPKIADQDLDKAVVTEVMDTICVLDIFEKNGEKLYVSPESAFYTETIITSII